MGGIKTKGFREFQRELETLNEDAVARARITGVNAGARILRNAMRRNVPYRSKGRSENLTSLRMSINTWYTKRSRGRKKPKSAFARVMYTAPGNPRTGRGSRLNFLSIFDKGFRKPYVRKSTGVSVRGSTFPTAGWWDRTVNSTRGQVNIKVMDAYKASLIRRAAAAYRKTVQAKYK